MRHPAGDGARLLLRGDAEEDGAGNAPASESEGEGEEEEGGVEWPDRPRARRGKSTRPSFSAMFPGRISVWPVFCMATKQTDMNAK